MDVKTEGSYPVFLINKNYGGRALDYRAENNSHGICMLICDGFRDTRTRHQCLMRIRRYEDGGMYIQGRNAQNIDKDEFINYKGKLMKAYDAIKKLIPEPEVLEGQQESHMEKDDKELNYQATMNDYQNKMLKGQEPTQEETNMCVNFKRVKNEEFAEKLIPDEDYQTDQFNQEYD